MSDFHRLDGLIGELRLRHSVDPTSESSVEYLVRRYNESEGNLHEIDGYNCPKCKNRGFIARVNEDGLEVHRKCKCSTIRETLRRARKSGLGDVLTEYTFKKYEASEPWQETLKAKAQAFTEDDAAKWFFIGGQVGCGKTHLCTAIAAHYIKAGKDVKYMLWAEDAKMLKALANDYGYQEKIREFRDVDVLYIDDFLKVKAGEVPTSGDMNVAFEIINHRLIDREKITIISSEKLLDEIIDYDEATMSRIYKAAGRYLANIPKDRTKNYRLKG